MYIPSQYVILDTIEWFWTFWSIFWPNQGWSLSLLEMIARQNKELRQTHDKILMSGVFLTPCCFWPNCRDFLTKIHFFCQKCLFGLFGGDFCKKSETGEKMTLSQKREILVKKWQILVNKDQFWLEKTNFGLKKTRQNGGTKPPPKVKWHHLPEKRPTRVQKRRWKGSTTRFHKHRQSKGRRKCCSGSGGLDLWLAALGSSN